MRICALLLAPVVLVAGQGRYARLGEFDGKVEVQLRAADGWMAAERNLPLPESAWIRTGPASRVEIELDDGGVLRLGGDSQGELSDYTQLSTGQRVTTLSLDRGVAYFTGQPRESDALTLAVPGAAVIFFRRARVRLEAADSWSRVSVLEGAAKFSCPAAEIPIPQGTTTRVEPDNPTRFFLERELPAMDLDRWSGDRDKALAANVSGAHVVERFGLADLDSAGGWVTTERYGTVWKPKNQDHWSPFQKGRWRWYDELGYTWVSDDAWGWLPYHYGRWTRSGDLGWVWVPVISQTFKPGDVYWLRGDKLVGWGPLAPGEQWSAREQPDQFLSANTTWAQFTAEARTIDPSPFSAPPKEPLAVASFAAALPSPPFAASRLDATRPALRVGSTRVTPVVRGVMYQDPTEDLALPQLQSRNVVVRQAAPPQPVVVITQPAQEPDPVAVPVPVPYPVIAGIITPTQPRAAGQKPPTPQKTSAAKSGTPPAQPTPFHAHSKRLHDRGEGEIYNRILAESNDPAKQIVDLDTWTRHYRDSDFDDERSVLYMRAYGATGHPDKVVETGSRLMSRGLTNIFEEPTEILTVLYLTTVSTDQLSRPNREQRSAIQAASRGLLEYTPQFFASDRKPPNVAEDDWKNARAFMDNTARRALAATRN